MIAFRVFRNNSEVCLAGVDGLGVLTAIVAWANRTGEFTDSGQPEESLNLTIGALHTPTQENLMWPTERLLVGDSVTIRIEEADIVSEPCVREVFSTEAPIESMKIRTRELAAKLGWTLIETKIQQAAPGADGKTPEADQPPHTLKPTTRLP